MAGNQTATSSSEAVLPDGTDAESFDWCDAKDLKGKKIGSEVELVLEDLSQ